MKLPEFNIKSGDHLSILLYGGELTVAVEKPVLNEDGTPALIKSGVNQGQIKIKKELVKVKIKGFGLRPLDEWKTSKDGIYQTNQKVLKFIVGDRDED